MWTNRKSREFGVLLECEYIDGTVITLFKRRQNDAVSYFEMRIVMSDFLTTSAEFYALKEMESVLMIAKQWIENHAAKRYNAEENEQWKKRFLHLIESGEA